MRPSWQLIAGLIAGLTAVGAQAQDAAPTRPELRPALTANVAFTGPGGQALAQITPGQPFDITVEIANSLGDDPPAGLVLAGWLRPVADSNLSCTEAARSFLATGRLPTGAIKLNGPVIGVAGQDGSFVIADPELDLATANLLGAARFDSPPASLSVDLDGRRFLASFAERGEVVEIAVPDAQTRVLAAGLDRPVAAYPGPGGSIWVLDQGAGQVLRIAPDGQVQVQTLPTISRITPSASRDALALAGDEAGILIDAGSGQILAGVDQPTGDAVALDDLQGSFALARLAGNNLAIHYLDAVDSPVQMTLPGPASRLAASTDGRWLLAFDPGQAAPALLIDVAAGRVIQRIDTGIPIAEIAFTDRAAYLMLADQSRVGVLDLSAIRPDQPVLMRDVMLGQPVQPARSGDGLLAPLWPQPGMLAVHSGSYTGFLIHDYSMMGDAPPMSALRLRGGIPERVATFDRSFREALPGRFRTAAVLPAPGQYELVTTTGIGALSFCAPLPGTSGTVPVAAQPGTVTARRDSADPSQVYLQLHAADGAPVGQMPLIVLVSSLMTPWRETSRLIPDAAGQAPRPVLVPTNGPAVIAITAPGGPGFHPLVLEVP